MRVGARVRVRVRARARVRDRVRGRARDRVGFTPSSISRTALTASQITPAMMK